MITPIARRVIPAPTSQIADDNGVVDPGWYGFFRAIWLRTGGPLGNGVALGTSPDLMALQAALNAVTAAILDLPALRLTLAATTLALADVQTLAAVQADPDPALVQPMPDLSELYALALTLPDEAAPPLPSDDPLILAILASD